MNAQVFLLVRVTPCDDHYYGPYRDTLRVYTSKEKACDEPYMHYFHYGSGYLPPQEGGDDE